MKLNRVLFREEIEKHLDDEDIDWREFAEEVNHDPSLASFQGSTLRDVMLKIGYDANLTWSCWNSAAGDKANSNGDIKPTPTERPWPDVLHKVSELEEGDVNFLIDDILPEGITFIGSLAGVGKTWFALALAQALTNPEKVHHKFLGTFDVGEPTNVIYLCPEMGARAFRRRCEKFSINERFYCQTMNDGALALDSPTLLAAIKELKPVVFFDTVIRFNTAEDENQSRQNAALASACFKMRESGAVAVVPLHHATKSSGHEEMTLENILRGTGDLGAIPDCVWGLAHDRGVGLKGAAAESYLLSSKALSRIYVRCVKVRDFEPKLWDFRVQLRNSIDERGTIAILDEEPEDSDAKLEREAEESWKKDPEMSLSQRAKLLAVSRNRLRPIMAKIEKKHDRQTSFATGGGDKAPF